MTRNEALAVLRLSPQATSEEVERAYQKLVRRYPPEFNPERFREIDAAYRYLTSVARRMEEVLLNLDSEPFPLDVIELPQHATLPDEVLEDAIKEMRLLHLSFVLLV